jgi:hypothetical protein
MVDAVREPLVLLDEKLCVMMASRSFYELFQIDPAEARGRPFNELNDGEWNIAILNEALARAVASAEDADALEFEHEYLRLGRRIMYLNIRHIADERSPEAILLVTMEDITLRRDTENLRDDLLRQKETLLLEIQHRIANSLQIIASIMLLKIRAVTSEETRFHLRDAHQRVMAVATVQQQLRESGLGDRIEIGPYLTRLCSGLAASMIFDGRALTIGVSATGSTALSGDAVSFGLIVTELVINSLKHGFPDDRGGHIAVDFEG